MPERLDVRRLLGRHVALEVEKLAIEIAGDAPRQLLLILLQRLGELRQLVDVVVELLRIDPHAVDRRADGQRLAGAIGDRAAMRRDLDHAHGALVALLGEKAVIDQLQLDRARREPDGAAARPAPASRPSASGSSSLRAAFARAAASRPHDPHVPGLRQAHLQLGVGDALDEGIARTSSSARAAAGPTPSRASRAAR